MNATTKIEWTDRTWNPVTGCTKVSPGCDRCYAETIASRFAGTKAFPKGFDVTLHPERLDAPFHWRKPAKVFVNSMSDLFHRDIPDAFIAQVFGAMALTPRHTYQVLTKRHARMRSLLNNEAFQLAVLAETARQQDEKHPMPAWAPGERRPKAWPLPNVWLGVSVENQKWADIRIPALLKTPAAVRFLSCEPLLGPLDLSRWMSPISPVHVDHVPTTWAEWTWPDWVPAEVREAIEDFWGESQYRSPLHWIRDMHQQGAPAFGSVVTMDDGFGHNPPQATGRFVHAWNNIGRLVMDDGTFRYTSFARNRTRREQQLIDWVIVGGESGHGARAMHPEWARSLRDQSAAADVPFLFKQWGEWGPAPFIVRVCDPEVGWTGTDEELAEAKRQSEAAGATHAHTGNWFEENGEREYWLHEIGHKPWSLERVALPPHAAAIRRWGKKAAGRELDGRTWDEYPGGAA